MHPVEAWYKAGLPFPEGYQLIQHLLEEKPTKLNQLLSRIFSRQLPQHEQTIRIAIGIRYPKESLSKQDRKLREDFPFLSSVTCPQQLKILAADKITAFHNYRASHAALFDTVSNEQQFATVKHLVENYIENRKIIVEFLHYKNTGQLLGKHRIFDQMHRLDELRHLPIVQLIRRKQQLEHNIWRIQSELSKKKKPHLRPEREARLKQKQLELDEVSRMISAQS